MLCVGCGYVTTQQFKPDKPKVVTRHVGTRTLSLQSNMPAVCRDNSWYMKRDVDSCNTAITRSMHHGSFLNELMAGSFTLSLFSWFWHVNEFDTAE